MTTSATVPSHENGDDKDVIEDDWGLDCDFFLFAQHQAQRVWMGNSSAQPNLEILCVEHLTPIDMVHLGSGIHDATGHCVWTACCLWIAALPTVWKQPSDTCCRVLELGSGTGLGGLALLQHVQQYNTPIQLTLTDGDPEALELCRRNVARNAHLPAEQVKIHALTWGDPVHKDLRHSQDAIFAADILYDIRLLPLIVQSAADCAKQNAATFYLAHVPRACYNATTSPDAPEMVNLEDFIAHQVCQSGFWSLEQTWRPLDLATSWQEAPSSLDCINDMPLVEMQQVGAALFVFVHKNKRQKEWNDKLDDVSDRASSRHGYRAVDSTQKL